MTVAAALVIIALVKPFAGGTLAQLRRDADEPKKTSTSESSSGEDTGNSTKTYEEAKDQASGSGPAMTGKQAEMVPAITSHQDVPNPSEVPVDPAHGGAYPPSQSAEEDQFTAWVKTHQPGENILDRAKQALRAPPEVAGRVDGVYANWKGRTADGSNTSYNSNGGWNDLYSGRKDEPESWGAGNLNMTEDDMTKFLGEDPSNGDKIIDDITKKWVVDLSPLGLQDATPYYVEDMQDSEGNFPHHFLTKEEMLAAISVVNDMVRSTRSRLTLLVLGDHKMMNMIASLAESFRLTKDKMQSGLI